MKITYPKLSRGEVELRLRRGFASASRKVPLKRAILFGSYASNRFTAASDVDVMVMYGGKRRSGVYEMLWEFLDVPRLELHVFHESEFRSLELRCPRLAKELERGTQVFP